MTDKIHEIQDQEAWRDRARKYENDNKDLGEWNGQVADGDDPLSDDLITVTLTGAEAARASIALLGLGVTQMQQLGDFSGDYGGAVDSLDTADVFNRALRTARAATTTTTTEA